MSKRSHAPCSEGQRQLCALPLSQREIGAALGTPHQNVQRWMSTPRGPSHQTRQQLAATFGIPVTAWDEAPAASEQAQSLGADLAEKLRARADAVAGAQAAAPLPNDVEELDALIAQLRKARAGEVAPVLLVKLASAETRAVEARDKLRSSAERAWRHPEVLALGEQLASQLDSNPLAMITLCRWEIAAAQPQRLSSWDAAHAEWRERHASLVEAAERANAALREVLPPGASFAQGGSKAAA